MTEAMKNVILALAKKAEAAEEPHKAMQLAQAALSVAQALSTFNHAQPK